MLSMKLATSVITSFVLASTATAQNISTDGVAFPIGGYGGGLSIEVVKLYQSCFGEDANPFIPPAPALNTEGWGAEYLDGKVFLCGGSNINYLSECYSLTIGTDYWDYLGEMLDVHEYGAFTIFNDEMVVLGGFNERSGWLDTVEKMTAGSLEWTPMDEWTMPRALINHCAVQKSENEIMVIGGIENDSYLDIVSVLDTVTGTWADLEQRLPSPRAAVGCLKTVVNGVEGIMVTGGCTDDCIDKLAEVLFYSIEDNSWTQLASLNQARMNHKMTNINGSPSVVGGYNDQVLSSVEYYEDRQWRVRENALQFGRWAFAMPTYLPMDEVTCGQRFLN